MENLVVEIMYIQVNTVALIVINCSCSRLEFGLILVGLTRGGGTLHCDWAAVRTPIFIKLPSAG